MMNVVMLSVVMLSVMGLTQSEANAFKTAEASRELLLKDTSLLFHSSFYKRKKL